MKMVSSRPQRQRERERAVVVFNDKNVDKKRRRRKFFDLVACCKGCGWVVAGNWGWKSVRERRGQKGTAYQITFFSFYLIGCFFFLFFPLFF